MYRSIAKRLSKERPGWHLSDFVACNWKTFYRKSGIAPESSPEQNMVFWMGHAAQFFLAPVNPEDAVSHEVDGILMTPDFANVEFAGFSVDLAEMKTTRKSQRTFHPKDTPHYLIQMMGYCKALGKTKCDLIMYFVHGDYTERPPMPTLDCWTVEFTQEEIDCCWEDIKRKRDILDAAMKSGEPPSELIMIGQWECNFCECKDFCPNYKSNGRKR